MQEKVLYGVAGNFYQAYRTVRKGGHLKFDGSVYQHDILKHYVGYRVCVVFIGKSAFASGPICIKESDGYRNICEIDKPLY